MIKTRSIYWIFGASFLITACTSALSDRNLPTAESNDLASTGQPTQSASPTAARPDTGNQPTDTPNPMPVLDEPPPPRAELEFTTDFSKHSIPYEEILSGGPPKDGIPAIDEPVFIGVDEADEWLEEVEPVIFLQVGDDARAYPLQILTWHEIVNDTVGGEPLTVTFCPLCNTAIAFKRTVDGGDKEHRMVLDFGTTGRLRFSNLIMYDRQTETWWQQATGEAIAGELLGTVLEFVPAAIISWDEFRSTYPNGRVLSRETGFSRSYGVNPYAGYDDVNRPPFLYRGPETPGVLPPVARVLTIDLAGEAVAYPYEILEKVRVVNDTIADQEIVVIWEPGTASALDAGSIAAGRDVGTANAFLRQIGDLDLTFSLDGERIQDDQTGSEWNVLGQAVSGELQGEQLAPVVAINHFWFSWAAFKPETRIYQP
jgi:hypothetical protein